MPLIVRAAGKRFAAPRPKPENNNNNYDSLARQRYFDNLEYEMRMNQPKKSAGQVMREYAENSTSHALPHVIFAYTTIMKFIWFLLFVVTVIAVVVMSMSTRKASKTDVESDLRVRSGPLQFPAVTVCNLNPLRLSQKNLGGTYFDLAIDLLGQKLHEANQLEGEPEVGSGTYTKTSGNLFKQLAETIDSVTLASMGHQRDDFIQSCTYMGLPCNMDRDFQTIHHETYGNCFVFNNDAGSKKVTALAGSNHGLQLWLNIEQWDYIPWLTEGAGAVVAVHDPGTYPAPEDQGVSLQPGWQTDVGVTLKNVSRKGYVHPCEESKYFEETLGYKYTPHACKVLCVQENLVERCGCGDAKKPIPNGKEACQLTNREQVVCMYDTNQAYNDGQISCSCQQPCREANYETRVTKTNWPAQSFSTSVRDYVNSRDSAMFAKIDGNGFSNNLLKVNVYFPSLTFYETTEDVAPENVRIWAEIGMHWASLGGFSVITWIEMIVLVFTLAMVICATAPGVM